MSPTTRLRPDWVALIGAAVTAVVHIVLSLLHRRTDVIHISLACVFWIGYVVVRARQDPHVFERWGFRRANLLPASLATAAVFAAFTAVLAVLAWWLGHLRFPLHTLLLMLVYPLWGVIQQFLALAIVVQNLERLPWLAARRTLLWLGASVLFGLAHMYDWRLVAGTIGLELVTILLYWRYRNLWPLGVLHGWMGALFYPWVLNVDMWDQAVVPFLEGLGGSLPRQRILRTQLNDPVEFSPPELLILPLLCFLRFLGFCLEGPRKGVTPGKDFLIQLNEPADNQGILSWAAHRDHRWARALAALPGHGSYTG
jgi:hypothetical protein